MTEESDGLDGFSQSHIVSEHSSEIIFVEKEQPVVALELVVSECGLQFRDFFLFAHTGKGLQIFFEFGRFFVQSHLDVFAQSLVMEESERILPDFLWLVKFLGINA